MGYPVVHWEIYGKDAKQLGNFYAELFDWKIDFENPMDYGMVPAGEGGIGGGLASSPEGGRVTIYVQVPDLQAALDRAEALGGKTVMPPTEIPNVVTFAHLVDPEGNLIGLVKG